MNSDRILNRIPSRDTLDDWTLKHAQAAALISRTVEIPAAKDLRMPSWPVGDQGDTGACVGWASADGVLRYMHARAGHTFIEAMLSPRFPWMAAKETDEFRSQPTTFIESEGTSLKAACRIAVKYGSVMTAVLPVDPGVLYRGEATDFYAIAAGLRARSYFNLTHAGPDGWKRWLATHGPILIGLDVDAEWDGARPGHAELIHFRPGTVRGGHAAALVGYTPSAFIVRNSWGTGWGDAGFAYAHPDYAAAAFSEAYGLLV